MKRFLFFTALVSTGFAAESPKSNRAAQDVAADLFATAQGAAAVAHLRRDLRPENGPDGATTALAQSLVEIACRFYNQRQTNLARDAAVQAFAAADPVIRGKSTASTRRRSDLLGGLGVLCEEVLLDLESARAYYDAAAALNPGNKLNAQRRNAVAEKLQRAKGAFHP
jgi:hypothetical protein